MFFKDLTRSSFLTLAMALTVSGCSKPTEAKTNPPANQAAGEAVQTAKRSNAPKPTKTAPAPGETAASLGKRLGLNPGDQLQAIMETSMGNITLELYWDQVPNTVANFVGLAKGEKEWRTPAGQTVKKPLYDGTIFHRVIPNFMIQGGDPQGTGRGGPGFTFADEFRPNLKHSGPGILSMANRGPNTNGSQFFITEGPTPHLNNRHSVFGKVIDGLPLVGKIARVKTQRGNRPVQDVVLKKVSFKNVAAKK